MDLGSHGRWKGLNHLRCDQVMPLQLNTIPCYVLQSARVRVRVRVAGWARFIFRGRVSFEAADRTRHRL